MTPICGVVMLGLAGGVIVTVTALPTSVQNIQRLRQQNMKCNCSTRGRSWHRQSWTPRDAREEKRTERRFVPDIDVCINDLHKDASFCPDAKIRSPNHRRRWKYTDTSHEVRCITHPSSRRCPSWKARRRNVSLSHFNGHVKGIKPGLEKSMSWNVYRKLEMFYRKRNRTVRKSFNC